MTPDPTPAVAGAPNLYAAVARAALAARAAHKDATNDFHRYSYASAEAIYTEARAALNAEGLAILPLQCVLASGPDGERHQAMLSYQLCHASGESIVLHRVWPVIPERGRPLDKAFAAAITTALAYLCRDVLLLPRVDEEVDRREDREDREPAPRAQRARATPAPAAPAPSKGARVPVTPPVVVPGAGGQAVSVRSSPEGRLDVLLEVLGRRDPEGAESSRAYLEKHQGSARARELLLTSVEARLTELDRLDADGPAVSEDSSEEGAPLPETDPRPSSAPAARSRSSGASEDAGSGSASAATTKVRAPRRKGA